MKVKLIILTLLVTLCSCGKETVETSGTAIGFAARSGGFTRGSVIPGPTGLVGADKGFDTWTYSHTGAWASASDAAILIDNASGYAHVTSDNGTDWDYGTRILWPSVKLVTSFAIAPHGQGTEFTVTPALSAGVAPTVLYHVPLAVADQIDLMIAGMQADLTYMSHNATIPESFNHTLSRIEIRALNADPATEVTVTAVTFHGIYDTGTASLDFEGWTPSEDTTADYAFSAGDLKAGPISTTEAESILTSTGTMFLLPQSLLPRDRTGLVVSYTLNEEPLVWTTEIPTDVWLPGKTYTYTLRIAGEKVAILCGDLQAPAPGDPWGDY